MAGNLLNVIYSQILSDFGLPWLGMVIIAIACFLLCIVLTRNIVASVIFTIAPFTLLAAASEIPTDILGYASIIIAILFMIAIRRLILK